MTNKIFNIVELRCAILIAALTLVLAGPSISQVSSGGDFTLEQKVIAGGGGTSTDAATTFRLEGTIGQSAAGTQMTGGGFTQTGGFWAFRPLAPTSASVPVLGRVVTANGRGVSGAVVTLTDISGNSRFRITNTFGYFQFIDIQVGQTLILSVQHRRYAFSPAVIALNLADAVDDIRFVAR